MPATPSTAVTDIKDAPAPSTAMDDATRARNAALSAMQSQQAQADAWRSARPFASLPDAGEETPNLTHGHTAGIEDVPVAAGTISAINADWQALHKLEATVYANREYTESRAFAEVGETAVKLCGRMRKTCDLALEKLDEERVRHSERINEWMAPHDAAERETMLLVAKKLEGEPASRYLAEAQADPLHAQVLIRAALHLPKLLTGLELEDRQALRNKATEQWHGKAHARLSKLDIAATRITKLQQAIERHHAQAIPHWRLDAIRAERDRVRAARAAVA